MVCAGATRHMALADFIHQEVPTSVGEVPSNVLRHHIIGRIESVGAIVHNVMGEHEQSTGFHGLSEMLFHLAVAGLGDGRVLSGHQVEVGERRGGLWYKETG